MKGQYRCSCSSCGLDKGDRDRNHGWYEVQPRKHLAEARFFCPKCSVRLLVLIDQVLEAKPDPTMMVVERKQMKIALDLARNGVPSQYAMHELEAHLIASGVAA